MTNEKQAKAAADFCDVATYMPARPGDPVETLADKAYINGAGAYLHCEWARKE